MGSGAFPVGRAKPASLSEKEIARLREEAERLGLRVYAYSPNTSRPAKSRGKLASAIRGRQTKALHTSVELIRQDRSDS